MHGEQHNMMRLKSKLLSLNASKTSKVKVYSPRNCEELRIPFKSDKTAKVVGKLAAAPPPSDLAGDDADTLPQPMVGGVLVQNDFKLSLMAPEDLREYAGLNTTTMICKQRLKLTTADVDLAKWALEGAFGAIDELPEMRTLVNGKNSNSDESSEEHKMAVDEEAADEEVPRLVAAWMVMGSVTVRYRADGEVELEWEGTLFNDGIADAVMLALLNVESSPAAVKHTASKHPHTHSHDLPAERNPHARPSPEERLERLCWFLEAQFGADNVTVVENPKLPKNEDGNDGKMDEDNEDDDELEERRRKEIERLHKIGIPVPGISIKVDKMQATVWLEDLEVESNNKLHADRVRAIVERAVEVTAPLWE